MITFTGVLHGLLCQSQRTTSSSSARHAERHPAHEASRLAAQRAIRTVSAVDPTATSKAVLKVIDAARPPLRLLLGDGPLAIATRDYESRLAEWREWEAVSIEAHGKLEDAP